MTDQPRLIETAFPLKAASLDSVHEKNVRHGHISTLHIWPARRPLAAARAALIATLLPDPGTPEERKKLLEKLGGKVVQKREGSQVKEETVGGILHWGRESGPDLAWFREEIRKAYGGRAPRVLDPFAGGGAIPLEAMRLGCEVTAIDINPVAWFILKCTLEYPQKLAGQKRPLPAFARQSREFMESYFKAQGYKKEALQAQLARLGLAEGAAPQFAGMEAGDDLPDLDLAWHVRAWGWWVLQRAKADLARFYPTVDGKPTVAYLWARTVTCKHCRATLPLLKTRWLCKKDKKRVVLGMEPHPLAPSPYNGEGEEGTPSSSPLHRSGEGSGVRFPLHRSGEGSGVRFPLHRSGEGPGVRPPGYVYDLARKLRARQTPTEALLWEALRDRQFGGYKFRRQHPLGRYIADFYCAEAALVVEVDGAAHAPPDQQAYDRVRDAELSARGLRLIRIPADTVEHDPEQALATIADALSLTPSPSPQGGEGSKSSQAFPPLHHMERGPGGEVRFFIQTDVPTQGKTAAERAAHDKRIGAGTMSRSGATCPCCQMVMTTEDIRLEGQAGRLGAVMTAVVVDGDNGKEYRLPTAEEIERASEAQAELPRLFADIPFGLPEEPLPSKEALGFRVPLYGFNQWYKLFTPRQLLALGTFIKHTRAARQAMVEAGYGAEWVEAVSTYLSVAMDKLADRDSTQCIWISTNAEKASGSFGRFALPITWDFVEIMPWSEAAGGFIGNLDHIAEYIQHALQAGGNNSAKAIRQSATKRCELAFDVIVTDPPYYDAIPYSDLMDFFYIWLRRTLHGLSPEIDQAFSAPLAPKWDHDRNDGELIDDASRFDGDKSKSKAAYEDGMARAFQACYQELAADGRLVIVFAHKQPDAWETLVSAIIRAGFVVDGSWPIQTERIGRIRAQASAALSSSVWLVCKKRPEAARPGWDNRVLEEMREKITTRLRDFWDAGIRGPDFVWAATGPALEAYSQYPIVKKANEPGQTMSVSEFLRHVRRMVVDFVVGRVLTHNGDAEAVSGLDDVTTYYLLHRHDFKMEETPIGPCILYAVSCGLSDSALVDRYDLLVRSGQPHPPAPSPVPGEGEQRADLSPSPYNREGAGGEATLPPSPAPGEGAEGEAALPPSPGTGEGAGGEVEDDDDETSEGSGSKVKLKPWQQRKRAGLNPEDARPIPLIDQTHRLMHLWRAGDVTKVDEYLEMRGLRRNVLFHYLLQSLIELAPAGSEERSLLESISNHLAARGLAPAAQSATLWSGEE